MRGVVGQFRAMMCSYRCISVGTVRSHSSGAV